MRGQVPSCLQGKRGHCHLQSLTVPFRGHVLHVTLDLAGDIAIIAAYSGECMLQCVGLKDSCCLPLWLVAACPEDLLFLVDWRVLITCQRMFAQHEFELASPEDICICGVSTFA